MNLKNWITITSKEFRWVFLGTLLVMVIAVIVTVTILELNQKKTLQNMEKVKVYASIGNNLEYLTLQDFQIPFLIDKRKPVPWIFSREYGANWKKDFIDLYWIPVEQTPLHRLGEKNWNFMKNRLDDLP